MADEVATENLSTGSVLVGDVIDILLPHYGDEERLREAVASVLAQDDPGWRLICVDDASPSAAGHEWLLSLNDARVHALRNERNLGVAGNFSRCLDLATAEWFVMMGADDVMLPSYISTVRREAARSPHADIIQPGVSVIDSEGRPARPLADIVKSVLRPRRPRGTRVLAGERMALSLTRADWAYFPSLLWRRTTATAHGFDARWDIALDLGLLLDIALTGGSIRVSDERCFHYRRHAHSASQASASSGVRFEQERLFFEHYARRFADAGWRAPARVARRRVISRLNAGASMLSLALRGQVKAAASLSRYLLR